MHMRRTYLREWRKHRNKTLVQVAEELHITHQQLGKIERGEQPHNQRLLEFLAEMYGCDETDLISRPPGSTPAEVVDLLDRLPTRDRQKAIKILEAFVRETGTNG
jgi:transcriptional regulator with XRE-family HTH domain